MFRQAYRFLTTGPLSKQVQSQALLQTQQPKFKSMISKYAQRFSTQSGDFGGQEATNSIKLKKKPFRFFLALLIFNGIIGFGYLKKLEYDNRYDFKILMKLLEFKKDYEKDSSKFTIEEIKKLFDEFLVENVAISFDEKITQDMRKITKELCEKHPKEREVQLFASQVCEYEKYAIYLKQALILDRKYIDDVLIRQMTLNCERFGKDKPYYFDEFYNTCTKYSLDHKHDEADECLQKYMSLNPPQYYRAAIQQIKNYNDTNKTSSMLHQIQDLFAKEKDLDIKEKEYILSFIHQIPTNEIKNPADQILAGQLLLDQHANLSQIFVKQALDKDKNNLEALSLQAQIYQKQEKTDLYNSIISKINKINPSYLPSQQAATSSINKSS